MKADGHVMIVDVEKVYEPDELFINNSIHITDFSPRGQKRMVENFDRELAARLNLCEFIFSS